MACLDELICSPSKPRFTDESRLLILRDDK
jgi:hypothetical protein